MSLDRGIRTGDVVRIVDIENGEQRDEIAEGIYANEAV